MKDKEYAQVNEWVMDKGVKKLRVSMKTKEFGIMRSRLLKQVDDDAINEQLLNSLGEELIDEYEARLADRPVVVQGWR